MTECLFEESNGWEINPKQMLRVAYRRRRRKEKSEKRLKDAYFSRITVRRSDKRDKRISPQSGSASPDVDGLQFVMSGISKLYLMYKSETLFQYIVIILDVLREFIPLDTYAWLRASVEDILDEHSCTLAEFSDYCTTALSNWQSFTRHTLFPIFSELINVASIAVLSPGSLLAKLSHVKADITRYLKSYTSRSTDIIDWVVKTFTSIVSTIKLYNETGDIVESVCLKTPDQVMSDIYHKCASHYTTAKNGSLDGNNVDFLEICKEATDSLQSMRHSLHSFDIKTCQQYIDRIRALELDIIACNVVSGQRVQPYAFALTGGTGAGKTNLVTPLMQHVLRCNNFVVDENTIQAVNPRLKHWDNVDNSTLGYKFDDPDFLLEAKNTVDYLTPIGRVLNNEQYALEKAEISEKGKVYCNCRVAALTSNDSEFGVYNLAKEPAAIYRRFQCHISVKVKPEFCKTLADGICSSEMDRDKVVNAFPDDIYPDVYNIRVYRTCVKGADASRHKENLDTHTHSHVSDQYCFAPIEWKGKLMVDVGIQTLIRFLTFDSKRWFKEQDELLARKKRALEESPVCELCQDPISCSCGEPVTDGVDPARYVAPSHQDALVEIEGDPIEFGRVPKVIPETGGYTCSECPKKLAANSLWFYKIGDTIRCCCRSCLAVTRVNCETCLNKAREEVGMRRPPKKVIKCTAYCKACAIKPEATTSDLLDLVSSVVEHNAKLRKAEDVYAKTLKELLREYFVNGKSNVVGLLTHLDSMFSHESAFFVNKIFDSLLELLRGHGLDVLEMWIPQGIEGGPIGNYLHTRSSLVRKISSVDKYINLLPIALSIASPISQKVLFVSMPLGVYCYITEGRPVSRWVPTLHKRLDLFKAKDLYHNFRKRVAQLPTKIVKAGALLLSMRYPAVLPILCAVQAYYMHSDYAIGSDISTVYSDIKLANPVEFRDKYLLDFIKVAAVERVVRALCYAVGGLRLQLGVNPQSGNPGLTIKDLSSLEDMDRYWYKKQWHDVNLDPLPVKVSTLPSELKNIVTSNLLHVVNVTAGTSCNAFAISSKKIIVPHHFVTKGRSHYKFTRKSGIGGLCGNATFKAQFALSDTKLLGGDLVVVDIPKSGDFKDMSKYFLENLNRIPMTAIMIHRNREGKIETFPVYGAQRQVLSNNHVIDGSKVYFDGLGYDSEGVGPSKCMSLILSVENPSVVLGFHLGGSESGVGVSSLHTCDDIMRFQRAHDSSTSVVVVPESGIFKQQQYGTNCVIQGIHPNSIAATMPPGEFKLFGSTGLVSKDTEDIIQTPISQKVREVMNCQTQWGPPKLKGVQEVGDRKAKWHAMLGKNTDTADMIPLPLLDDSVEDYMSGVPQFVKDHPPILVRPLTDFEVIHGIPGMAFIEPMDPNTSVGFPLGGAKRKYMEQVYDEENGNWRNVFTTDMFEKSARKNEKEYIDGRRVYPVFKTFSKIEPTDVTKDKVRMVNGAPLDMQITMRKYVLPILKYLSDHPDFFECSVGINPYGRQWDVRYKQLRDFGGCNRIIALDHKDYDLRMSSQLVGAAFSIIVQMAVLFGYSESELSILRGLAADTMWPVLCLNGDLIMLFGSTVSGHNATVYINCLINSIMMRIAFFESYPGGFVGLFTAKQYRFREAVRLYTYGDDLVGSVKQGFSKFNNRTILTNLAQYGFILTSYDKKPVPNVYDKLNEIEFLKRKFVYDANIKTTVAPLNEASIFKRLCCIHKPKAPNTMEIVLSSNIDSALYEWFFYGPEKYKLRHEQLTIVVGSITCPILRAVCQGVLSKTYNDRLATWNSVY